MAEPAAKQPKPDLSQNKANVMLRKAAEGKYGVAGVCVVSLANPSPDPDRAPSIAKPLSSSPPPSTQFPPPNPADLPTPIDDLPFVSSTSD